MKISTTRSGLRGLGTSSVLTTATARPINGRIRA